MIPRLSLRSFFPFYLLMSVLLAACGGTDYVVTQPAPTPLPTCVSAAPDSNPYLAYSQLVAQTKESEVYRNFRDAGVPLDTSQQAAFSQLAYHVKHLSDAEDFILDGARMVRVTLTYMDPELVGFIFLNQVFYSARNSGLNMSSAEFDTELQRLLMTLSVRNETLFLVTVTSSPYAPEAYGEKLLRVNIPFAKMRLSSTSEIFVLPRHYDHILTEPILVTRGPASGYVGFPISILSTSCTLVVDSKYTTSLTLDISQLTAGGSTFENPSWSIFYDPLMEDGSAAIKVPKTIQSLEFPLADVNMIFPSQEPPQPNPVVPDIPYWETMAKYVWFWIWMEHHY